MRCFCAAWIIVLEKFFIDRMLMRVLLFLEVASALAALAQGASQ